MSELLTLIRNTIHGHSIIPLVMLMVLADTFFGCLRAVKQRCFNSCVGIDGAIRKVAMVGSLVFLVVADTAVNFNMAGFLPAELITATGLANVGTTEFFGLLFVMYEAISILKNMTQCGLPTHTVEEKLRDFLGRYTNELPDAE